MAFPVREPRPARQVRSLDPKAANNNLLFAVPYGSITTPIVQDVQVYLIN